ncbi:MAG: hypothetical protein AAF438_09075 [Pseudomonadota bacterium]
MQDDLPLSQRLEKVQQKRGYLLPHHGLLAASSSSLLDAYDELYSRLTLTSRHLSPHNHEFVWLAVLMSKNENLGTHHVKRFFDAKGTNSQLAQASAATAFGVGSQCYVFSSQYWLPHTSDYDPEKAYELGFRELAGDQKLLHLACAATHMCCGHWAQLGWQIKLAYGDKVNELALIEALSLAMLPAGVPSFAKAAGVWRQLILDKKIKASPELTDWANLAGQGGFDEAAGIAR